ncbi:hypothetical protein UFOVP451_13 [uncultured Caudovirales phage]|uniref:Uncharacterized protein n=1 Tax=uncultured Caudovirales phage TaxID=2100421 RepID=A0A6J5MBJ7_9CAUD|nr:hypothetical protein UFOVP451_13 [uncultured Caudovirales phage]
MDCPICGKECDQIDIEIVIHEADFDDVAEYVFKRLVEKGYAINFDDINMILDIVQEYMMEYGENDNDEKGSIG